MLTVIRAHAYDSWRSHQPRHYAGSTVITHPWPFCLMTVCLILLGVTVASLICYRSLGSVVRSDRFRMRRTHVPPTRRGAPQGESGARAMCSQSKRGGRYTAALPLGVG